LFKSSRSGWGVGSVPENGDPRNTNRIEGCPNTVTIPNNVFLTNVTSCGNYGVLDMQVVVDFHIGLDQDVRRAMELVRESTAISRYVYLAKPIAVVASQVVTESFVALRVRLKAYVLDTRFEKEFETDVTLRVMEAFDQAGIGPPAVLHRHTEPASIRSR
jgi:small-conductance mechanosensitive channel